jgi:hypothetical protein
MGMETRVFKSKDKAGNEVTLRFTRPSQTLISKGDFIYREYFSKSVRTGIMTNAEANKLLKERGLWGEEQEATLIGLRVKLNQLEGDLFGQNKESGIATYKEIKKLRDDLEELSAIKSSVADNTAESVAAEMRTQFFASECVVYNDSGKRVFKDLTDFLTRMDEPLALDSYRQALISNFEHLLGIKMPTEVDSTLPEDRWLNEMAKQESDAKPPVEEKPQDEPAAPKKRGRKKESEA